MEFVQRGGRGQTPNPNFFAINFGSTEKTFWGRSQAIDTDFWIQTYGGSLDEIPTFIFIFLMKTSLS